MMISPPLEQRLAALEQQVVILTNMVNMAIATAQPQYLSNGSFSTRRFPRLPFSHLAFFSFLILSSTAHTPQKRAKKWHHSRHFCWHSVCGTAAALHLSGAILLFVLARCCTAVSLCQFATPCTANGSPRSAR